MLRKISPIVVLLSAAALAGCGGGGSEAPAPARPAAPAAKPATAPTGYQVSAVTGGGSIGGSVKVTGEIPEPEVVEVNKDNSTCGNEQTVVDVRVGGGGELADAVVWIEEIKQGKAWADGQAGAIDQKGCVYHPYIQALRPEATIEVINSDPVLHNIHAYKGDETLFNIAQPMQGQKTPKTLPASGPVHMKCDVHSWMSAYIFIATTPYFAITAEDGSFSLGEVPPGSYNLKVWHSRFGEQTLPVTVESGSEASAEFTLTAS